MLVLGSRGGTRVPADAGAAAEEAAAEEAAAEEAAEGLTVDPRRRGCAEEPAGLR